MVVWLALLLDGLLWNLILQKKVAFSPLTLKASNQTRLIALFGFMQLQQILRSVEQFNQRHRCIITGAKTAF